PPARLHWRELRDLEVDLAALACREGELTLVKRGTGRWRDNAWAVDVELSVELPTGIRDLAHLELVYSREPPEPGREVQVEVTGEAVTISSGPPLVWQGFVVRVAQWQLAADGAVIWLVRTWDHSDLWDTSFGHDA